MGRRDSAALLLLVFGTLSCAGDSTPTDIHEASLSELAVIAGDQQTDTVGNVLVEELVVKVLSTTGAGVPAVTVTWEVLDGGGSIDPVLPVTDGTGRVIAAWTLGVHPGTNRVRARVAGLDPAEFTAEAVVDAPAAVIISPAEAVQFAAAGDTTRLDVAAVDQYGNTVDTTFAWSTTDTAVALVDEGLITAVEDGQADVVAHLGTLADSIAVTVARIPSSIELVSDRTIVNALQDTFHLTATVADANDVPLPEPTLIWTVEPNGILALDESASLAIGTGVGEVDVIVRAQPVSDTVHLTVAQIAADVQLTIDSSYISSMDTLRAHAVATDSNGFDVIGREFGWTSSDTGVIQTDAEGLLTAVQFVGSAKISATMDGVSDTLDIYARTPVVYTQNSLQRVYSDGSGHAVISSNGGNQVGWADNMIYHTARFFTGVGTLPKLAWTPVDGSEPTVFLDDDCPALPASLDVSRDGNALYQDKDSDRVLTCRANGNEKLVGSGPRSSSIWSPGGTDIAWIQWAPSNEFLQIAIDSVVVFGDSAFDLMRDLAWSPDGSRFAFVARPLDGTGIDIFVVGTDGSGLEQLTTGGSFVNAHPTFTPDGKAIVYAGDDVLEILGLDGADLGGVPLPAASANILDIAVKPGALLPTPP